MDRNRLDSKYPRTKRVNDNGVCGDATSRFRSAFLLIITWACLRRWK